MSDLHLVWFFGCIGDSGHYLWSPVSRGHDSKTLRSVIPWGDGLDGGLCPGAYDRRFPKMPQRDYQPEGYAAVSYRGGWTALAWWDRSVDSRPGSNAAVLVHELATASELLERARVVWPEVFSRLKYQIVLQSVDGEVERT